MGVYGLHIFAKMFVIHTVNKMCSTLEHGFLKVVILYFIEMVLDRGINDSALPKNEKKSSIYGSCQNLGEIINLWKKLVEGKTLLIYVFWPV